MIGNDLDNYFMRPQFLEGVGNVYPISIFDYERFRILASKYITQGITTLHNLFKVNKRVNVLDHFVNLGIEMDRQLEYLEKVQGYIPKNEEEQNKLNELNEIYKKYKSENILIYSIKELEELFSMILKKEVIFKVSFDNPQDYVFEVTGEGLFVTRDNFEEFKNIIQWQNLLYEMPTSKDKKINEDIQRAIKLYTKDSKGGDLCAMISVVGIERGLSDEEIFKYTYYRLRFDYEIITRKLNNIFVYMLRSQGCSDAKITELSEEINLRFNPYDMIVGDFKVNSLDRVLQQKQ